MALACAALGVAACGGSPSTRAPASAATAATATPRARPSADAAVARTDDASSCPDDHPEQCYARGLALRAAGKRDRAVAKKAARAFVRGCALGHAPSCEAAGEAYSEGFGVDVDRRAAARSLEEACAKGEMRGCALLSLVLRGGGAVKEDRARARALADRACRAGVGEGCNALGLLAQEEAADAAQVADARAMHVAEARAMYRKACDLGHAFGCRNFVAVGGTEKDRARAASLLARACDGDVPVACYELANRERFEMRDDEAAVRHLDRACALGHAVACAQLGNALASPRGVPRDEARAAVAFARACDLAGDCGALARAYAGGLGVERDTAHALDLIERTCVDRGDCSALVRDAKLNDDDDGGGEGFRRADALCTRGVAAACDALGDGYSAAKDPARRARALTAFGAACRLHSGFACVKAYRASGVGNRPGDASWLEAGCNAGWQQACVELASALADGRGVARDPRRAVDLAKKACDAGWSSGCEALADAYDRGRGVARDWAMAAKLRDRACDAGSSDACRALAAMFRAGRGVPKDVEKSKALEERAREEDD